MLRLFDRRRLASSVHQMEGHGQSKVSVVSFSQQKPSLALSGGYDKFVSLWDLDQIGADQDPEDAEDGPPELLVRPLRVQGLGLTATDGEKGIATKKLKQMAKGRNGAVCFGWRCCSSRMEGTARTFTTPRGTAMRDSRR